MRCTPFRRVGREGVLLQRVLHGRSWGNGLVCRVLHHAHESVFSNDSNRLERFAKLATSYPLAKAAATFANGKTFAECADATPANVGPKLKAHYARMALTRAKARCLRDALNVGICTLEELTED